jgi:hypothetical protein
MPYVIIEDFRAGLDRRKLPAASPQGSLQTLKNAHITRGGEIEKRLEFTPTYALPAGQTFGSRAPTGRSTSSAPPCAGRPGRRHLSAARSTRAACKAMTGSFAPNSSTASRGRRPLRQRRRARYFYDGARSPTSTPAAARSPSRAARPNFAADAQRKGLRRSTAERSRLQRDREPTEFQAPAVGFGFKNMSNQSAGSETLTALGRYQNLMAVFARRNIQIWYLDPDPLQNVQKQVPRTSAPSPPSRCPFGDIDVFFLSDSGIRSLRARDSSNQAGVSDVGTPIDEFLLDYLSTLTDAQKARRSACLEPISGRYILAVGTRAFVFSYFASSRTPPGRPTSSASSSHRRFVIDGRVWGAHGRHHLSARRRRREDLRQQPGRSRPALHRRRAIATFKNFTAIDIVCEGEWRSTSTPIRTTRPRRAKSRSSTTRR